MKPEMLHIANMIFKKSPVYLDNGGDELLQEVVTQQRRPVMVDEVDQQTLNVGAVLILSQ